MQITRHDTGERMSKAVIHGSTVYLCGQTADGDGVAEQTQAMLAKVDTILKEVNSDKTKILSATIYLSDMINFEEMNKVWDAWVVQGLTPARACVEAKMCREEILIEISVIASI